MTVETPQRIEPALIEGQIPEEIAELVTELAAYAATLGAALHPRTAASLADLVRIMNAYYSNLIEGHNTRPADIERALAGQIDGNEERRNLQFEAASHVHVQRYIDVLATEAALPEPASTGFLSDLHRRFYRDAPGSLLQITNGDRVYQMIPGAFRSERAHDVVVGRHQPPSSERVNDAMTYFAERYRLEGKSKAACILAAASAHHRFNYIHPFPDGNGRVSRLMSHAMLQYAGVGSYGLWSVSRGLARGIEDRGEYKVMLDLADAQRASDFDGRGNLSLKALVRFVAWFLRVCIDQVRFMSSLFELNRLSERLYRYGIQDDSLGEAGARLLEEAAIRGEFERGAVERISGLPGRSSRRVLKELLDRGILASDTPRGAVSLRFGLSVAEQLFPRLFMPPGGGSNEASGFS